MTQEILKKLAQLLEQDQFELILPERCSQMKQKQKVRGHEAEIFDLYI